MPPPNPSTRVADFAASVFEGLVYSAASRAYAVDSQKPVGAFRDTTSDRWDKRLGRAAGGLLFSAYAMLPNSDELAVLAKLLLWTSPPGFVAIGIIRGRERALMRLQMADVSNGRDAMRARVEAEQSQPLRPNDSMVKTVARVMDDVNGRRRQVLNTEDARERIEAFTAVRLQVNKALSDMHGKIGKEKVQAIFGGDVAAVLGTQGPLSADQLDVAYGVIRFKSRFDVHYTPGSSTTPLDLTSVGAFSITRHAMARAMGRDIPMATAAAMGFSEDDFTLADRAIAAYGNAEDLPDSAAVVGMGPTGSEQGMPRAPQPEMTPSGVGIF